MENLVVQLKARADESFSPGQKIHLVALGRMRRNRIVVHVEAFDEGKLVLRVPEAEQTMLDLVVDGRVELGIGYRIARMHFVCSAVVRGIEKGFVTLSRPSIPRKQPRRSFARVAYRWPTSLQDADGLVFRGTTRNVSASGALIEFPIASSHGLAQDVGARFALILVGIDGREYRMEASLVRTVEERRTLLVAVHFEKFSEVERVRLELQVLRGIARRFLRVAVPLACEASMEVGGEQQLILGTSENISGGGVALQFDGSIELNVGSRGSLSIALDGTTITLDTVRVLRVLTPSKTGTRAVLEFPDISYALRVSLVEFLMKKLGASRSCAD